MIFPAAFESSATQPPKRSATDVQKRWRSVLSDVNKSGCVVIKNHDAVEAIVLSPSKAERIEADLAELVQLRARVKELDRPGPSPIEQLRQRFLDRLSSRDNAAHGDRLREAAQAPARLGGRLKVGDRF